LLLFAKPTKTSQFSVTFSGTIDSNSPKPGSDARISSVLLFPSKSRNENILHQILGFLSIPHQAKAKAIQWFAELGI
jgi:hypothetical protein